MILWLDWFQFLNLLEQQVKSHTGAVAGLA